MAVIKIKKDIAFHYKQRGMKIEEEILLEEVKVNYYFIQSLEQYLLGSNSEAAKKTFDMQKVIRKDCDKGYVGVDNKLLLNKRTNSNSKLRKTVVMTNQARVL